MDFNRIPTTTLAILPQLPITLEKKTIYIDVMVVQGPLDFNLLLGRDYFYTMKVVFSTLFQVMYFPHDGKIVTADQISFVKPDYRVTPSH